MNDTPRKVKFNTKVNILKKKPVVLLIGLLFTFIPLFNFFVIAAISSAASDTVPKVDYDLICRDGKELTGIITSVETQSNFSHNDIHPTIISYQYKIGGETLYSKTKIL